jgi:hypothetical protein
VQLHEPFNGKIASYIPCSIDTPNDLTINGVRALLTTYDADGMRPTMVFMEQCVSESADCYAVYMNRGDLHQMQVYVPVVAADPVSEHS